MKKIIISILVGLVSLAIGVFSYLDVNPTSLLIYHDNVPLRASPILSGKNATGEFVATENNLAIVRIRLRTYNRFNTTHVVFKLKEKGEKEWLVTNTYAVDRIPDGLLYPFGFPKIIDSKGKMYEFELSSPDGTSDNAIGISGGYHGVAAQYVQPLPLFLGEKIISTARDPYSVLYISIFFIPTLVYATRKLRFISLAYLLVVYSYLPVSMHSNIILYVAGAAFFIAFISRASASIAFVAAIACLVQIPFAIGFGNIMAANRLATIVFFLFAGGGVLSAVELRKKLS